MSGLSGHMMHPHEDITINKDEYKFVVAAALGYANGAVVKEKVDGFGLQFTLVEDEVRLVRSKGDLINAGVSLHDIDERMAHNPSARYKYKTAITAIQEMFDNNWSLRNTAMCWPCTYNCEVIQPGITNVISYNRGWKVYIHNCWERETVDSTPDVISTGLFFENMAKCKTGIVGLTPVIAQEPRCSGVVALALIDKLDKIFSGASTVREYYKNLLMKEYGFGNLKAYDILDYIFKNNPMNLRALKNEYGDEDLTKDKLREYYEFVTKELDSFDLAIGDLAVDNDGKQHSDIANTLANKLGADAAQKQLARWSELNFHIGNTEGITINDRYKFTGSFGPLNQLIGMVQYNM